MTRVVFVHISAVERAGYISLAEDAKISHELKVDPRKSMSSAEGLRLKLMADGKKAGRDQFAIDKWPSRSQMMSADREASLPMHRSATESVQPPPLPPSTDERRKSRIVA